MFQLVGGGAALDVVETEKLLDDAIAAEIWRGDQSLVRAFSIDGCDNVGLRQDDPQPIGLMLPQQEIKQVSRIGCTAKIELFRLSMRATEPDFESADDLGSDSLIVPMKQTRKDDVAAPRLLTVRDLADYLRVHTSTVYRLLRSNQLPGFRIGSDWRFNAELIEQWCRREGANLSKGKRGRRKRAANE